jgi:3-isopropylmalate dehydrogenase
MFEPVHGSAPDLAGRQLADPTAAILSAGLLLDHLGYVEAARSLEDAVARDLKSRTPAPRTTAQIGTAIADELSAGRGDRPSDNFAS